MRALRSEGTQGLCEFFKYLDLSEKKYYNLIPPLLEKKYHRTMYCCHEFAQMLTKGDIDGDGEITILDIDFILY